MALKGIDISEHQGGDYKHLIDVYGKDFVIVRAAFGRRVDKTCDKAYQYAKSKGKKLGVYFFPLLINYTPETYAKWCYEQVKGYIGEACFFLDWEDYIYNNRNINPTNRTDWALGWLKEFERLTGNKPLIYMNSSVEAENDWSEVTKNGNGLWIANYGRNDGINHGYTRIRNWRIVAMHQFTSRFGGQHLDGDVFFGDRMAWAAYAKLAPNNMKPEPEKPATKPQEPADEPEAPKPQPQPKPEEKPAERPQEDQAEQEFTEALDQIKYAQDTIKRLTATIELLQTTQKKHGLPNFEMPSKLYDFLKFLATIGLPAANTLYIGLSNIWGFGFGPEIDATIQLVIAMLNTTLGAVVRKASNDHARNEALKK